MRMKYRKHGQIYFRDINVEMIDGKEYHHIPKKGSRPKEFVEINDVNYVILERDNLKTYLSENDIDLSTEQGHNILVTIRR